MAFSEATQATLLLTARLAGSRQGGPRPLTATEWGRFAAWLKECSLAPDNLLGEQVSEILRDWVDERVSRERIGALLDRGPALALAADKWQAAGLWVVTRSDTDYPAKLKQRLGRTSPAVLFGAGNRTLLSDGGLAVVGSRNASDADLRYARSVGQVAAEQGHTLISGGARGIDASAMIGALEAEGTVVGVLADGLLRKCTSAMFRTHLASANLVLFSSVDPQAPFHAGSAMQRNRYIYCLSDAALVVHSGTKGGTWTGASENLKHRWTPLWVKQASDPHAGNAGLIGSGASPIAVEADKIQVRRLFDPADESTGLAGQGPDTVDPSAGPKSAAEEGATAEGTGTAGDSRADARSDEPARRAVEPAPQTEEADVDAADRFYNLFLKELGRAASREPVRPQHLVDSLGLELKQVNTWLSRAETEKRIAKSIRPVRYEWVSEAQGNLFED